MFMSFIFYKLVCVFDVWLCVFVSGKSRSTRLSVICIMTECNNEGRSVTEIFVSMNYVWVEFFKIPLLGLKTCTWHFYGPFNYSIFCRTSIYTHDMMYYQSDELVRWPLLIRLGWKFPKVTRTFFKQYNITMILSNDFSIHETVLQQYSRRCTWMGRSKRCKHLHVLYSTTTIIRLIFFFFFEWLLSTDR